MSGKSDQHSGPSKTPSDAAARSPHGQPASAEGMFAQMAAPVRALLGMQRRAGNQAVQRAIGQSRGLIQRDGTIYMDPSGVGHKEPDKSKAPPVIHMDAQGVGHKAPDPSKAPPVIHMDAEGVGHKTADKSPKTPSVIHMDAQGVGHDKADEVQPDVAGAHKVIKSIHDKTMPEVLSVKSTMALWKRRLTRATNKNAEAQARASEGYAKWNVEAEGSGLFAAQKSELAVAAGAIALKAYNDSAAQKPAVEASALTVNKAGLAWSKNNAQFAKDKAGWLKKGSPMTLAAVTEIQQFLEAQGTGGLEAVNLAGTADAELAKLKIQADAAVDWGERSQTPLSRSGGDPYRIIGMLQQKLNATRAAGDRLTVHADFDAKTEAALRAFQGTAGVPVTGIACSATWAALDAAAPSKTENDQLGVGAKGGAQETAHVGGQLHPNFKKGGSGPGVKEMQQRLNNWIALPANAAEFKALKVDGSFGFADRTALKKFQKKVGLPETGEADKATWAELDKVAGAVSQGEREFGWRESVEGINNVGMTAKFSWEVKNSKLSINVNMKFTGASSHAMVATWLQDIKDVWNHYKAVEVGAMPPREFDIDFNPIKSSSGFHKIKVGKPTKANPNPRSDAANWYVNDTRKGLAPHEFGHLIGLEDEYNRPEEQAVAVSGLEPTVGQVTSSSGSTATEVSNEIKAIVDANTATKAAIPGLIAAKVAEHGITQGAFARLVATKYEADYGFGGEPDMARYIAKLGNNKWTGDLTRATKPFLVSNKSIMGTMQGGMGGARDKDFSALAPHDHPVQPRHIRTFANLISLAVPGTLWEPKRR